MTPAIEDLRLTLPGIRHGFFTRAGGVSTGLYASLNCGVGSKRRARRVAENRARVAAALGAAPDRLATPYQVHGTDVVVVDRAAWAPGMGPKADAVVTDTPGIAIGRRHRRLRADPVRRRRRRASSAPPTPAGAARSPASSKRRSRAMERLGARRDRIVAVLGPTISQTNYEVGSEVRDALRRRRPRGRALLHAVAAAPGTSCSTCPATSWRGSTAPASPRSDARPLHLRRPGRGSSPTAAPPTAAKPTTAAMLSAIVLAE